MVSDRPTDIATYRAAIAAKKSVAEGHEMESLKCISKYYDIYHASCLFSALKGSNSCHIKIVMLYI